MPIHDLFLNHPTIFLVVVTLLGLIVGSFLNVVIYRLPTIIKRQWSRECREWLSVEDEAANEVSRPFNLVSPRSECPKCGHKIKVIENIPIISYFILGGKCSECHTSISIQYPLVEALSAIFSLLIAWHFGYSWQTATALLLTWALIALSVIDLQTKLLPDPITLPFVWLGLIVNTGHLFTDDLESSVWGAVAGYLSLWSIYQLFRLLTGKEGMGYGDFKLLAVLGAWLGWQVLPLIIILSSIIGTSAGITLLLVKRHDRNIPIPFGPYLALGGWVSMLWGTQLTQAYLEYALG
jgi:leader peptidase (prepilin peptidase)/N-methyltransferase